jgi:uroporphyrinogen-III synthase
MISAGAASSRLTEEVTMKKRVVLTREAPLNDELAAALRGQARVRVVELTETEFRLPTLVAAELSERPLRSKYQTVAVTSARAAPYAVLALSFAAPDAVLAAVGKSTLQRLGAEGALKNDRVISVPDESNAAALGELIDRGPVLALTADSPRPELRAAVSEKGLVYDSVVCYSTVQVMPTRAQRRRLHRAHVVVIAAPSAWRVARLDVNERATIVTLGVSTASEVRRDHPRVRIANSTDMADVIREVLDAPSRHVDEP